MAPYPTRISRTNLEPHTLMLTGDPKRVAVAPLRGYIYQLWHSLNAWLLLGADESLFLEGAEDFDINETACQVKATQRTISLKNKEVSVSLANFWNLRSRNPGIPIQYRLLTRSRIVVEHGTPFGPKKAGLVLWEQARESIELAQELRQFLAQEICLPDDLHDFLTNESIAKVQETIFRRVYWETEQPTSEALADTARELLIIHGDKTGIPPSKSERIVDSLLRIVADTATGDGPRRLCRAAFLRHFEELTTERLPSNEVEVLRRMTVELSQFILPPGEKPLQVKDYPLLPLAHYPMRFFVLPRKQLVARIRQALTQSVTVFITGSTGTGKTIAARLAAQDVEMTWHILSATGMAANAVVSVLRQATAVLRHGSLIVDDLFLPAGEWHRLEPVLGVLSESARTAGTRILVTTTQQPSISVRLAAGASAASVIPVTNLTKEETAGILEALGCPKDLAVAWSKVVNVHTGGHPQLVHAQALALQHERWPGLEYDKILAPPHAVVSGRQAARALLIDRCGNEERELLFRLSVIQGEFERSLVICIGTIQPELARPGELFDSLIGPWIEPASERRYTVSELLRNAATEVFGESTVRGFHNGIAEAIGRYDSLSVSDAAAMFLHAFRGGHGSTMTRAALAIMQAPRDIWRQIADRLEWFVYAPTGPRQFLMPTDLAANSLLRMLQFDVATQVTPSNAEPIAKAWDRELPSVNLSSPGTLLNRYVFLLKVICHVEAKLDAATVVKYLAEFLCLQDDIRRIPGLPGDLFLGADVVMGGSPEQVMVLFSSIIDRCDDVGFLGEFLSALEALSDSLRSRVLAPLRVHPTLAMFLIDRVWIGQHGKAQPTWGACILHFERAAHLLESWSVPNAAAAAVRGLSIVHYDYLHDSRAAEDVLDLASEEVQRSPIFRHQRARLAFMQDRFQSAFDIWCELLPDWVPDYEVAETTQMFAWREMGIAAAHLGKWAEAVDALTAARDVARKFSLQRFAVGFLADRGYAKWRMGNFVDAFCDLAEALYEIEQFPDTETHFKAFAVKKLHGQVVLSTVTQAAARRREGEVPTVVPGMCSNPDPHEGLRNLPNIDTHLTWMLLAEVEEGIGFGYSVSDCLYRRDIPRRYPMFAMTLETLRVYRCLRSTRAEGLPEAVMGLEFAFAKAKRHMDSGREIYQEEPPDLPELPSVSVGPAPYIGGLIVAVAENADIVAVLSNWFDEVSTCNETADTLNWINRARELVDRRRPELVGLMRNRKEEPEDRVLASLSLIAGGDCNPDELIYAHFLLTNYLFGGAWRVGVEASLARIVRQGWLKFTEASFLLRTARLIVPDLINACQEAHDDLSGVAKILLAASGGVSIRLGQDARKVLQALRG